MAAKKPKSTDAKPVTIQAIKGETETETMARVMVEPYFRHGVVASGIVDKMMGKLPGEPQLQDYGNAIKAQAEKVSQGDLAALSQMLTAQAISLDTIFSEMARRSTMNMGEYIEASERYMRLALKAQTGSRATVEALARLHMPREQTVKHVHVNEGGQAVVADNFHQHGGSAENGKSIEQSHATGPVGESSALPCPDADGHGVPIPGRRRKGTVPNARGD